MKESKKVYNTIYEQIKRGIANGQYLKGSKLPSERKLSEVMQVSRSAVREALKGLEIIGLVESKQGEGNFISLNTEENFVEPLSIVYLLNKGSMKDIVEMRRAIQVEALRLLLSRGNDEIYSRLETYVDVVERSRDEHIRMEAHNNFHLTITKECGNVFIHDIFTSLEVLFKNANSKEDSKMLKSFFGKLVDPYRGIVEGLRNKEFPEVIRELKKYYDVILMNIDI